ncbi:hypothetical protein BC939DRAFT_479255 [Gamsiella multidivaricata]|uniref:uncharacterized protein n=1 Tax=Gamsiella multidivaricata TaxID=101098 RepID=UPI00221E6028|nr:uncharacterized protein BC939DRAFT_479255 [Gamsiella multidivaricata]KAG0361331.1 hypothetical protein BGZ54_009141 [Gamsiella multidivaricata]KAI7819923.1 hypothetical protein BC939DRAFT_479255 [Gamsiella multidivaricata]
MSPMITIDYQDPAPNSPTETCGTQVSRWTHPVFCHLAMALVIDTEMVLDSLVEQSTVGKPERKKLEDRGYKSKNTNQHPRHRPHVVKFLSRVSPIDEKDLKDLKLTEVCSKKSPPINTTSINNGKPTIQTITSQDNSKDEDLCQRSKAGNQSEPKQLKTLFNGTYKLCTLRLGDIQACLRRAPNPEDIKLVWEKLDETVTVLTVAYSTELALAMLILHSRYPLM